ncbi:hypothetical protein GCM10017556_26560 [Micromonospora sagamiensis]|uniref:Uncharacterized protein n=2 Tax=Micromonospora sagamiensis TaxID=47875 RepID=A0A562WPA8_9ACTN|nr:hypothetical protein JD81_05595 [Micromonospora sagamiensis]BCL14917.1 hypothetical protein GCM10017556_26560 [Micromonospora sagamiensis]
MLNRTAVRRRSLSRVSYAAGLLVLIGAATALVVVVRVPAHSTTQLTVPTPPGPSADGLPGSTLPDAGGHRPGTGAGQPEDALPEPPGGTPTGAGRLAPAWGAGPDDTAEDLHQSLVLSGLLGLAVSLTGLVIVGSRRRMW